MTKSVIIGIYLHFGYKYTIGTYLSSNPRFFIFRCVLTQLGDKNQLFHEQPGQMVVQSYNMTICIIPTFGSGKILRSAHFSYRYNFKHFFVSSFCFSF